MPNATLNDVIKVLQQNDYSQGLSDTQMLSAQEATKDELGKLNKMLSSIFLKDKANAGDKLEEEREKREKKDQVQRNKAKSASGSNKFDFGDLFSLDGLKSMILPLTGGLAALGLAFAGFRGWELNAIKEIDMMKLVPTQLTTALKTLKARFLGVFGLLPDGTMVLDPNDPLQGTKNVGTVRSQIAARLADLKTSALKIFGLDEFGNVSKTAKGIPDKPIIGRVTFQINRLLKPLMNVADGVAEFATGSGAKLFNFIRGSILGGVKVVAKTIGRVLWPIGILFSLFDGVRDYQNSDADGFIARLGDGVGGFLGDLIGAPFDLLKAGVNWIFDKVFGVKRDENGNVTGDGWAAWASEKMKNFSFEETIGSIVSAPFKIFQSMFDFITDPEYRAEVISDATESLRAWGKSFAGAISSVVPDLSGFTKWIQDNLKKFLPTKVYDYIYPNDSSVIAERNAAANAAYGASRMEAVAQTAQMNAPISALRQFDLNADGFLSPEEIEEAGGIQGKYNPRKNEITRLLAQDLANRTNGMGVHSLMKRQVMDHGFDLSMRDARGNPSMSNTNLVVEGSRTTNNQGLVTGDPRPFDRIVKGY